MSTILTYLRLKMYWKGYDIEKTRVFLRYEVIKGTTKQGRLREVAWPADSPTRLPFIGGRPEYPSQIVKEFCKAFHHEIFVDDSCDIKIITLPNAEGVVSREGYNPVGTILSPLSPSEYLGALKLFMEIVNHDKMPSLHHLTA